ncbi:MAG: hypothetical protein M1830_009952, partial [Pleopsidium flavum]
MGPIETGFAQLPNHEKRPTIEPKSAKKKSTPTYSWHVSPTNQRVYDLKLYEVWGLHAALEDEPRT